MTKRNLTPKATTARTREAVSGPETSPREPPNFMSVRQVAEYLHINEKKVYSLVSEGKLPASKLTGKWLFPRQLVDQWVLESTHGGLLTDRLLTDKIAQLPDFPEHLANTLSHAVLSHHGQREWGAPILPSTPEACALHYADNLDARVKEMMAYRRAF